MSEIKKTYNPIHSQKKLENSLFKADIPAPIAGTVMVLSKELPDLSDSLTQVSPGSIVKSDIRYGKYKSVYYVDISPYELEFKCNLPSIDTLYNFIATVRMNAKVKEPKKVIVQGINNVCQYVNKCFEKRMLGIAARFPLNQMRNLEQHINDIIDNIMQDKIFDFTDIICNLTLDERGSKKLAMDNIDDLLIDDKINNNTQGKEILNEMRDLNNAKWNDDIGKIRDVAGILSESVNAGVLNAEQATNLIENIMGNFLQRKSIESGNNKANSFYENPGIAKPKEVKSLPDIEEKAFEPVEKTLESGEET